MYHLILFAVVNGTVAVVNPFPDPQFGFNTLDQCSKAGRVTLNNMQVPYANEYIHISWTCVPDEDGLKHLREMNTAPGE